MTTKIAVTKRQKSDRAKLKAHHARLWAAADPATGTLPRWMAAEIVGSRGKTLDRRLARIEVWGLRLPVLTNERKPEGAIIPAKAQCRETSIFAGFERRIRGDDYPAGLMVRFNGMRGGKVLWLVL